jgi:hypothetical protein
MIARHWRGWTKIHNADAYESLLKSKVLPELHLVAGSEARLLLSRIEPIARHYEVRASTVETGHQTAESKR